MENKKVQFFYQQVRFSFLKRNTLKLFIETLFIAEKKKLQHLNVIFCTDEALLAINKRFLNHNYYTDIITFDYSQNNIISGDIFISLDTVKTNAEQFGVAYEQELHRIIIHGILHLCGQDDKTPESRKTMTAKENEALNDLANNE